MSKGKKYSFFRLLDMKRISKSTLLLGLILTGLFSLTGCRSIVEEDPNEAQIPWATPADWEGQLPGMPSGGGGY